ncbi:MAG TPA: universal stress protein [Dehalococcoidales bacterium]|nr:universal stress protein [Dehalococcoidales bacterium]
MFERILLPLDGSELAEAALPYARNLAEQLEAEIYLIHICPPEHQFYTHMHQIYLNSIQERMLQKINAGRTAASEKKIQAEVLVGDPVKAIFDFIKMKKINLVALTTHGNSGFKPWAMGNVADKIVRGSGIPTLLIRINSQKDLKVRRANIQNILVPLDISEVSKTALPYAIELAQKLKAGIHLFSMAQTAFAQSLDSTGAGIGINWSEVDKASEKGVNEFLEKTKAEVSQLGIPVEYSSILGIDAAFEILEIEKKGKVDMLVMATRGRSSIARWAFGSVAEKVLREGNLPILLIKEKPAG